MSTPTLDRPPATPPSVSSGRRSRRPVLLLAAAALVLATAFGASLAYATRPDPRPAPAADAAETPAAVPEQSDPSPATGQPTASSPAPEQPTASSPAPEQPQGDGGNHAPVLADGTHDARITKVDRANDRIVVDVVQVFHDDEAVKAAIADGRSRSDAQYLTTWVRNENPRLRTLPLAANLDVRLVNACDEPGPGRDALLTQLAANASQKGTYYYSLTVSGGSVQRIQERLAINAC
jgi:hypothetical protein